MTHTAESVIMYTAGKLNNNTPGRHTCGSHRPWQLALLASSWSKASSSSGYVNCDCIVW